MVEKHHHFQGWQQRSRLAAEKKKIMTRIIWHLILQEKIMIVCIILFVGFWGFFGVFFLGWRIQNCWDISKKKIPYECFKSVNFMCCSAEILGKWKQERADIFTDIFTSSLSLGNIPEDWSQDLDSLQKVWEYMKYDRG